MIEILVLRLSCCMVRGKCYALPVRRSLSVGRSSLRFRSLLSWGFARPLCIPAPPARLDRMDRAGVASCTAWGAGSAVFRHFASPSLLASLRADGSGFSRRPRPPPSSLPRRLGFAGRARPNGYCSRFAFNLFACLLVAVPLKLHSHSLGNARISNLT